MEGQTILVLGATGGSGIAFVEESLALSNPPNLILYARTPSKLPEKLTSHAKVSVATGSLSDYEALDAAMKNHSVTTVVSFLGAYATLSNVVTRSTQTPIADSFPVIIKAMRNNDIQRIIVLSTPSYWVKEKDVGTLKLSLYGIFPKLFTPQGNAEMVKIAENVYENAQDLEWTIFRIPHLTDGPGDLPVAAGYAGPNHKGGLNLSRKSQARWVLGEIVERKWVKEAPFIGNS